MTAPKEKNPHAWRPSKVAEIRGDASSQEWRPSQAAQERLSSLSPARSRKGFRLPRGVRPLITFVLFFGLLYVVAKLWFEPEAGELRPALLIVIVALILILVAAVAVARMRRRRTRGDDKSTLRL